MTDDTSIYEQQSLIEDSARRFLENHYSFADRCLIINEEPGYSTSQWREMAELGWMLLPMSAEFGGLGGNATLVSTLAKEFGRSILVSPYLVSAVISTQIIEKTENEDLRSKILDGIGSGDLIVTLALYEPQSRYDLENITTTVVDNGDKVILDGKKSAVLCGNVASEFLVLANWQSSNTKQQEYTLCLVPSDIKGIEMTHYRTHDGGRMSDVVFDYVQINKSQVLFYGQKTLSIIEHAVSMANAVICAELVGAMEATLEMTLEYLKTRQQFGKKLSSFQSLQHRVVDMFMRCQMAESMRREAARAMESPDKNEREMMVSAAKCEIARAAQLNAEEAIQLHGAMGMMDEMPVGHYLKRIFTLNLLFGDADHHQSNYRYLRRQAQ